ncbi:hypothetical protein K0M31_005426, partial [Melipona bicolor]
MTEQVAECASDSLKRNIIDAVWIPHKREKREKEGKRETTLGLTRAIPSSVIPISPFRQAPLG